ncbi:MAG: hypothetical protein JST19_06570 [Bacteroidetes bacterium]|nr:hypothetical protein [Bacteroidota bacterium]
MKLEMPQNNKEMGVMLSLSKHGGQGLHPHILRQAQDDSAPLRYMILMVFLCLLFSKTAFTQNKDTTKSVLPKTARIMYVVDGVPKTSDQIDNSDILIRQSIAGQKLEQAGIYPEKPIDSLIAIVTREGAIKSYQKKFAAFSTNYRRYLEAHQSNDEGFLCVVDGVPVQGKRNGIIETLYKIPPEKIRKVGFNAKEQTHGSKTLVIINTKQ